MSLKAILVTNKSNINQYYFSFIVNNMKMFSTTSVVLVGSDFLKSTKVGNNFHLHIPFPIGIDSISQLSDEERDVYSKSIVDLITMEIVENDEKHFCFFQNFDNFFLIPQIEQFTNFTICTFFNEHIFIPGLYSTNNTYANSYKSFLRFSDKIIYSSLEVARCLKKEFNLPNFKMCQWGYGSFSSIKQEESKDSIRYLLGIAGSNKLLTIYGEIFVEKSLYLLINVLTLLIRQNPSLKIILVGSINYEFITNNLCLSTKMAISFTGNIEELEMQKISLISSCVIYLGDKSITDSSFVFILENNRTLITFSNNVPFEYRKHINLHLISNKSTCVKVVAKSIVKNATKAIYQDVPQNDLGTSRFLKKDLRITHLEKILLDKVS